MDDEAWQQAEPLTEFTQTEPVEGQPASERTHVRILYDDTYLYVGVICYDAEPSKVIVTDSRRDSSLAEADSFQMILDTYHDRQNGFIFGTSAAGIQYDAQVRDEGEMRTGTAGQGFAAGTGRAQQGSGAGANLNWDASWDVKARIVDVGWTAEFRIPLRTLRYGPPPQVWGVNFYRNIRRKREIVYWAPVARQYTITRLSSAGELRGLQLKAPRNFAITPYAISSANRNFTAGSTNDVDGDIGVDAKFGITPAMNLDLTYNTDFAQVEVDEEQVNLTRYNLVFPEKRPFFLENAGLFTVGRSGNVDLFFSRRIGISEDGGLVPIRGGARVSGKARGVNIGLLDIQTDDAGRTPANNFSALRVNREFPNRSSAGAIFIGRVGTGAAARADDWNRTWGLDGKFGVGEALTFSAFAAKTETPGLSGRQYAYSTGAEYRDGTHRAYFERGEVAEDFNPEVGFLRRPEGSTRLATGWYVTLRQEKVRNWGYRELLPHFSYERHSDLAGNIDSATLHMDNHLDWANGYRIDPAINVQWEGLDIPFQIYPGVTVPAGTYRNPHTAFQFYTDRRKPINATLRWDYGGFLSGRQNSTNLGTDFRQGGNFNVGLRWIRNAIDLPQGAFTTNLGAVRVTYNFTTQFFVQSLMQYNDRTERWSANLRMNWLRTANTGLFLVYNDTEALNGLGPINRVVILKYSHQINVLR